MRLLDRVRVNRPRRNFDKVALVRELPFTPHPRDHTERLLQLSLYILYRDHEGTRLLFGRALTYP